MLESCLHGLVFADGVLAVDGRAALLKLTAGVFLIPYDLAGGSVYVVFVLCRSKLKLDLVYLPYS